MSLTIEPPVKPRINSKTNQKPKRYWTLHTRRNDAFTLKINEKSKTSIVGFKDLDDAIFIGKMIETHFVRQKEWPDTKSVGSFILQSSQTGGDLHNIFIKKWEFNDLKINCTKNFLDLVSVDSLLNTKNGYTFSGNMYTFEGSIEFYKQRMDEIFNI